MNTGQIREEAQRRVTTEEFYWAVCELVTQAEAHEEHAQAFEDAIQWCMDHKITLRYDGANFNIMLQPPYHHMVWGPTFLDAVEQGRVWIAGFEHD